MVFRWPTAGIVFVGALFCLNFELRAEQTAITKPGDLNCSTSYPPLANVTDLTTGRGIGIISYDLTTDKVPPCGGDLPTQPPIVQEYPLNGAIPQLVKIKTDSGQCSGNLIAQNAVITAGHCVFDQSTKKFATGVKIIPGYQNGNGSYGTYDGASVLTFQAYTASNLTAHDVAIIKFISGEGLPQIYGLYGMSAFKPTSCDVVASAKPYTEPHYSPNVSNNEAQAGADGVLGGCVQGMVATTLALLPGSSGSGVVDIYSRSIFAVHSQYSLTPNVSYDAVLTHAKICAIWLFLADNNSGSAACFEGN